MRSDSAGLTFPEGVLGVEADEGVDVDARAVFNAGEGVVGLVSAMEAPEEEGSVASICLSR